MRQAVFGIVVLIFDVAARSKRFPIHDENAGIAQQVDHSGVRTEHIIAAIGAQLIGQILQRPGCAVLQDAERTARDDPEAVPAVIPPDSHDDAAVHRVFRRVRNHLAALCHVDASAVRAKHQPPLRILAQGKDRSRGNAI